MLCNAHKTGGSGACHVFFDSKVTTTNTAHCISDIPVCFCSGGMDNLSDCSDRRQRAMLMSRTGPQCSYRGLRDHARNSCNVFKRPTGDLCFISG